MIEKKMRIHVIKRGDGWIIRNEKADKVISVRKPKDKAIAEAMAYKKFGYDVIVHKKDGSVELWVKS